MKSMLLASVLVGGTIAGVIAYYNRKSKSRSRLSKADKSDTLIDAFGNLERPAHHTMG